MRDEMNRGGYWPVIDDKVVELWPIVEAPPRNMEGIEFRFALYFLAAVTMGAINYLSVSGTLPGWGTLFGWGMWVCGLVGGYVIGKQDES